MRRSLRSRLWRTIARRRAIGAGEVALGLLMIVHALPTAHAADTVQVTLSSSWTDVLNTEFEDGWEPAMRLKSTQSVLVDNQIAIGDKFSRDNFLKGLRDFVVTGSPISSDEIPAGAKVKDFWSIPISVTGLVFTLTASPGVGPSGTPNGGWFIVTPAPDPDSEDTFTPYSGPVRMRAAFPTALAQSGVQLLRDARFLADNDNVVLATSNGSTSFTARSDPGALNYHLSKYLLAEDAVNWNTVVQRYGYPANYVGETWPIVGGPSRALDSSMMPSLADRYRDISGSSPVGPQFGITTPGRLKEAQSRFDYASFRATSIKNAAGEWVEPTPAAITLGIQAGLTTVDGHPVFKEDAALTDATATGAYPLTWVNWMHVPKTGLSIDKTNAIATVARYAVTDGQAAHDAAGEARLPDALAKEALRLADEMVKSNCVGTDRVLTTRTDPGPFAPDNKLTGVTSMAWCDKAPPVGSTTTTTTTTTRPTTTTTTTTTAPPTTASPTTTQPATLTPVVTTRTVTTAPTTTVAGTTTTSAPSTTVPSTTTLAPAVDDTPATLPFGSPQPSAAQFDQLTTMLLGGSGLADGARRLFRKRAR